MSEAAKQQDEQVDADLAGMEREAAGEDFQAREGEYMGKEGGQQEQEPSSAEICTMLAGVTFAILAARRGAHWGLSDGEAGQLGEAGGKLMDKHLGDAKIGPEGAFVMAAAVIVMPRLAADRAIQQQQQGEQEQQDKQQEGAGSGGESIDGAE